jgi:hypothetical protein
MLDREHIVIWGEELGATVTVHHHSTLDGTLEVLTADWKKGRLAFNVIYPDSGERMPVLIRLKPLFEGVAVIDAFQAKEVVRGGFPETIASQEWRIPEYTYMLNVPLLMEGKKAAADKVRDELVKRLSPHDRRVFEHFGKGGFRKGGACDAAAWAPEEPVATVFRRYAAQLEEVERQMREAEDQPGTLAELKAQQQAIYEELGPEVQKFLRGKLEKCLAEAGMSQEGRRAVVNALPSMLRPWGQR